MAKWDPAPRVIHVCQVLGLSVKGLVISPISHMSAGSGMAGWTFFFFFFFFFFFLGGGGGGGLKMSLV